MIVNIDLRIFLDFLVFFLAPFILIFKNIDDYKYRLIAFKKYKLLNLHLKLSIIFWILLFVYEFYNFIFFQTTQFFLENTLMLVACFLSLSKRRYKLYNSIEEIYEALLEITLISYCFSLYAALLISGIIILTSISAGLSKLKSKIWIKEKVGLIMFLELPSVSRKFIRHLTNNLIKKYIFIKNIFIKTSILIPLIQIISGLGLFIFPIFKLNFLNDFSLFLQLCFSLLLFLIADLSWITSFYGYLILFFYCSYKYVLNSNLYMPNFFEYLFITIVIIFLISVLLNLFDNQIFKKNKYLDKFFNKFGIGIVPFEMFTEIHMVNIITFHISGLKNNYLNYFNAFNELGYRDSNQNLNSRHCQALMYPIGDLVNKCFLSNKNTFNIEDHNTYISSKHRLQCLEFFKLIKNNKVLIFQHHFSLEKLNYETNKVAELKINENSKNFEIIRIKNLYPSPRKIL